MKKKNIIICVLVAIIFLLIFVISINALVGDKYFHLNRLLELANQIKNIGLLNYPYYINFESLNNMGYAVALFYSDALLIIPALVINLNVDIQAVYGYLILISFIGILISAFCAYKKYYNDKSNAMFFALTYTFMNFILFEIVERSALGANFSYIAIPWVVLSTIDILTVEKFKYSNVILGLSMAVVILGHMQTAIIVVMGLILLSICYIKELINKPKKILRFLISIGICFALDLFFILPMLEQMMFQDLRLGTTLNILEFSHIDWKNIFLPNYIWSLFVDIYAIINSQNISDMIACSWAIPSCFIGVIILLFFSVKGYLKFKKR